MTPARITRGALLGGAGARVLIAAGAVLLLWGCVLWAYLAPPPPTAESERSVPARPPGLQLVVAAGQPSPAGGNFNRFDVQTQPIVAPVNARGHVAFYASVMRSRTTEGIFLATEHEVVKLAGVGDKVSGAGTLSEFAGHPVPAINDLDNVVFGAAVSGARATEGVFIAGGGRITTIALSGNDAPGITNGTFVDFDVPTIDNWNDVAFVATVRQGRETLQALYLYAGNKLRKLVAEGDRLPPPQLGTFDKFGVPVLNNRGVIAIPATLDHAAVLGGIFLAGSRDLRLTLGAGAPIRGGDMLVQFSERVAINDDDNIALSAHIRSGATIKEAVLLVTPEGITEVAAAGDHAPGGGTFSAFGPWPSLGPGKMVAFIAGVEDGPGPIGLYALGSHGLGRIAMVGQRLPNGKLLPNFALNPVVSMASNGGLTFATAGDSASRQTSGIYYFGPSATAN